MLPKLYVIIDKETLDAHALRVGVFARELRDAGVTLVQYRDKESTPHEILRGAVEVSKAFAGVDAMLVMNDNADLAKLAGWNAVHVGQGDIPISAAKKIVSFVGVSTHFGTQVLEADTTESDYIAIGPVFATSTKKDPSPVVGLKGVRRARSCTTKPLVAIGGITLENCASVIEAGADSVAVISGVFVQSRSVGEVVRDFIQKLR